MKNPFRKSWKPGAPSMKPTYPPSAEKPMPVPKEFPIRSRQISKPTVPPGAEPPME